MLSVGEHNNYKTRKTLRRPRSGRRRVLHLGLNCAKLLTTLTKSDSNGLMLVS